MRFLIIAHSRYHRGLYRYYFHFFFFLVSEGFAGYLSFPKTDINFDSDKTLQVLENEGLVGRRVYISPEPAMAGYLGGYISDGKESLEWFYMPFLQAKGLYACFRVQGRSMEEYVLEGSCLQTFRRGVANQKWQYTPCSY